MTSRSRDLISATVLLIAAVAIHLQARGITSRFKTGVDSGFFPEIVTTLLAIVSLAIGLRAALGPSEMLPRAEGQWRVLAVLGGIAAALLFMPLVGFLPVAAVLLFVQMVLLTSRGHHRLIFKALLAVTMAVAVWAVFTIGFGLILP